jgi:hypothetical protein
LNPSRPYFIPTHPRVTTTVRFPREIGAPDGSVAVFAEDAEKAATAEYLVSWQQGESYFTITPLRSARMANLNVPYQGNTYVLYFYPVDDPLNAAASVTLGEGTGSATVAAPVASGIAPPPAASPTENAVQRASAPPESPFVAATPSRLLGLLDRLKLIHATEPGARLTALTQSMGVQLAFSREDVAAVQSRDLALNDTDLIAGLNDYGWYQVVLLRAVRDRRLNCIGFICLVRNTSDRVLAFDVNSFGARAGAEYLMQKVSDATPILQPHEQAPAYFIVEPPRNSPLQAANAWRISVDLLSPCPNPGAVIASGFAATP